LHVADNPATMQLLFLVVMSVMAKKGKAKKNSQLIVRINDEERLRFIELCEEMDTSAAREVRRFIRDFIKGQETQSGD
tara:strand:+ start:91 stop:324 length:234 start_codon:yes stop_codon:yes gene_type:complete